MVLNYNHVLPWGRSFEEYLQMFDLTEDDLKLKILSCGDGPASFNVECNKRGGHVISLDPIYHLSNKEIQKQIQITFFEVLSQTEKNKDKFIWQNIKSIEELGKVRLAAMQQFLENFEQGKAEKKYIPGSLPDLPFPDISFDIVLSSHFLFLYSEQLSYIFHYESINEMLRVADEVRIFPLLDMNANKSPYVSRILSDFKHKKIILQKVNYEFQKGGNEVLIIKNI